MKETELATAFAVANAPGLRCALERTPTEADGWLARTHKSFAEQRIGRRFAIRGTHLLDPPVPGRVTLTLNAGVVEFGSGEHKSAAVACLRWSSSRTGVPSGFWTSAPAPAFWRWRPLHCCIGRCGPSDIDPWAVRVTRENAWAARPLVTSVGRCWRIR